MQLRKTLLAALITAAATLSAGAEPPSNSTSKMTLEQNIATPAVSVKAGKSVARHMESIIKKFEEKGIEATGVRSGEVVRVTIPVSDLFDPNESRLKAGADAVLGYFRQAVSHPESYRLIVAVYADDTGDADYSEELTKERATSVLKGLSRTVDPEVKKLNIDTYWFGNTRFLVPNNTITNRAKNRRVEFYIVPEERLVTASRAG